jgi:hypothetical protein
MTEIEQLRKEINELRERLAIVEARPISNPAPLDLFRFGTPNTVGPVWNTDQPMWLKDSGHFKVTCGGSE